MKKIIEKLKNKRNVAMLGIVGIILVTLGVTYTWFTYSKSGKITNTLETGNVKFIYNENNRVGNGISIQDAMPMSDEYGKQQDSYFDFSVKGTSGSAKIPYEITVRRTNTSDNLDEYIKLYLSEVGEAEEEEKVLSMFDDLSESTNEIAAINNEKTLLVDEIPAGATDYTNNYRLRMWLNNDAEDGSILNYTQTETGSCSDNTYDNETDCIAANKDWTRVATSSSQTFTIKVNVYAEGKIATQQEIAEADSTGIRRITVNNREADVVVDQTLDYDYYVEVPSGTTEADINVSSANDGAKVKIEKLNNTSMNEIQRLSTEKIFELSGINNYYKITVTSKNRVNRDEYILKVAVVVSHNADLSSLSLSNCTLSPTFSTNTTNYTCTTGNQSLTATYTTSDAKATVQVNGANNLTTGSNTVNVVVTAEDGSTTKTYKVTVTKTETVKILNKNYAVKTTSPSLTAIDTTNNSGNVYRSTSTNSGNPTYYFRGQVDDNYVSFAGFTWRIIRKNEDGTIRIIMQDGINNNTTYKYHNDRNSGWDSYYTYTDNIAKPNLTSWYNTNISNKGYSSAVASGNYFCEQAAVKMSTQASNVSSTMVNYNNYTPTFKCVTNDGNNKGIVNSNIGLITYDEAVFAGGYVNISNQTFYLYNGYTTWTMSPAGQSNACAWDVGYDDGQIRISNTNSNSFTLRAVVNLKSDVISVGNGTQSNPFTIVVLTIKDSVLYGSDYTLPSNITVNGTAYNVSYTLNDNAITNTKDLAVGTHNINYKIYNSNGVLVEGIRSIKVNSSINFGYTGGQQTIKLTKPGNYKLEVWGAQGGYALNSSYPGGKGGYSTGTKTITSTTTLYVNVGGQGKNGTSKTDDYTGGYNGGGTSYHWKNNNIYHSSGGGATHIALDSGQLSALSAHATDGRILIVAGGGGGSYYGTSSVNTLGGAGGGTSGTAGAKRSDNTGILGLGGNQTAGGGTSGSGMTTPVSGSFGKGGNSSPSSSGGGAGGGGGYYGGGGSTAGAAGGGSGYIGGVTNGQTINGTQSTVPKTSGSGTETGHSGNGYARITYLGE